MNSLVRLTVAVFLVLGLTVSQRVFGQNTWIAPQSIAIELGGNAGLYSVNYDAIIKQGKFVKFGTRVGVAYWHVDGGGYVAPVQAHVLLGHVKSYMEIGAGVTLRQKFDPVDEQATYSRVKLVTKFGYREQPPSNGFTWGVAVLPQINLDHNMEGSEANTINVGFGVHVGYAFGGKVTQQ